MILLSGDIINLLRYYPLRLMTNFSTRIRLIFIPFLAIALGFMGVYTLLDYVFIIRLEMPVSDDLVHYWLIFGLIWIPLLIWLRPRLKLLALKDKKGNLPFLYQFIAAFAIVIPTLIAQDYLTTATGKLTVLDKIGDLKTQRLTKYFELRQHFVDKRHIAVHERAEVSGRNNEDLTFYIDVVCPILDQPPKADSVLRLTQTIQRPLIILNGRSADSSMNLRMLKRSDIASITVLKGKKALAIYGTAAKYGAVIITTKRSLTQIFASDTAAIPRAWLGIEFSKEMNNNLSREEKNSRFKTFASSIDTEFSHKNLDSFTYLDRIGTNDRRKAYLKALNSKFSSLPTNPVIFEAKNEPFEARNGGKLSWIFKSFGIGALVWLIMIMIPGLKTEEIEKLPENALATDMTAAYKALRVFGNSSKFQVTAFIVAINVLVFLLMVFSGLGFLSFQAPDLVKWGGNIRSLTTGGQWWRLLTSVFVHGGLMHLLLNMYGLFFAAIFIEPVLGKLRYAWVYLVCGISASVASIGWHDNVVAVGASGAIFGLYGVLIALVTTNKLGLKKKSGLLTFSLIFIGINLLSGLRGNIDNAAHIGGLAAGILLGYSISLFGNLPDKEDLSEIPGLTEERATEPI